METGTPDRTRHHRHHERRSRTPEQTAPIPPSTGPKEAAAPAVKRAREAAGPPGIAESFSCVICHDVVRPPAMQCTWGCVYCNSCLLRATTFAPQETAELVGLCHACRRTVKFTACPFIDRTVADYPAECSNGCGTVGLRVGTVEAHETGCRNRDSDCAYARFGCTWVGKAGSVRAHGDGCRYRLHAEFTERAAHLERTCTARLSEMSSRIEVALSAVRGIISPHTATKLSAWLAVDTPDDRPSFDVAGRAFSFRTELLAVDPDIPELKRAYGCCVVRVPHVEGGEPIVGSGSQRDHDERMLWVRMQVLVFHGETAVGAGSIIGTMSETVPSALATTFVVPITQPPPWRVFVTVIAMRLLTPPPT
jgi:hypothetical protein